jgi:hypothetical protein
VSAFSIEDTLLSKHVVATMNIFKRKSPVFLSGARYRLRRTGAGNTAKT